MPFVPDAPAQAGGSFVPDAEPSLMDNAIANARRFNPVDLAKGGMETLKEGAFDLPLDIHKSLAQLVGGAVTGKDPGQTPMGARMQGIAESEEVQHPVDWAKKNPIDAALQAATLVSPFLPKGATLNAGRQELAERSSDFARKQAVKSLEGMRGQVMQLPDNVRQEVGQYLLDKKIISPTTPTSLGVERRINSLSGQAGEAIGAARRAGDVIGGAPAAEDLTLQAHSEFSPTYETGRMSGRQGEFNRAMETLHNPVVEQGKMAGPEIGTFQGNAAKATEMYGQAIPEQKLAQSKESPYADIAGMVSHENNAALQQVLTPQEFQAYQGALKDYSTLSKVQRLFERGESKEWAGGAHGGPITDIYQGLKSTLGRRTVAAGADTFSKALQSPGIAKALPILSDAAKRGPAALTAAHFTMLQNDPSYNKAFLESIDGSGQ